ncbi:MAG: hemagluttinin repeat-containing protein [Chlorobi bacterium OLB7]|nr:MAG: hemagluttinin repeat-containing protein [Chlorobi bacterium OLB7]
MTTDGGTNWQSVPFPDSLAYLRSILFRSYDTGFVAGAYYDADTNVICAIYKTTNNGKTWKKSQINNIPGLIYKISFPNDSIGYACGYASTSHPHITKPLILKTIDYGETWEKVDELWYDDDSTYQYIKDYVFEISFMDSITGYAILSMNNYSIYFTTKNGGKLWKVEKFKDVKQSGRCFYRMNDSVWLIGGRNQIYRTTNRGITWTLTGVPNGNSAAMSFYNNEFGISVPGSYVYFQGYNRIQRTYDSGKTWEFADSGIRYIQLAAISVASPTVAYCAGLYGRIYKTIDGGGPAMIITPTGVIEFAEGRKSFAVFPNPTTSTLKLTYELSSQDQQLVVSDLLGNMVLETTFPAGTTETTLNFTELPTGTYFCRLGKESRAFVVVR